MELFAKELRPYKWSDSVATAYESREAIRAVRAEKGQLEGLERKPDVRRAIQ